MEQWQCECYCPNRLGRDVLVCSHIKSAFILKSVIILHFSVWLEHEKLHRNNMKTVLELQQLIDQQIDRILLGNYFDNQIIVILIFKTKMANIPWLQLLKHENLMLFLVLHNSQRYLWGHLRHRLRLWKLTWACFDIFWPFINKTIHIENNWQIS